MSSRIANGIVRAPLVVVVGIMLGACGGNTKKADSAMGAAEHDAGAPQDAAPTEPPEETGPVEHPFAKSTVEATGMMDDAVDTQRNKIGKCVDAYRKRKNEPMARLVVKIGVDQEGALIGVAGDPKESDKEALACVRSAIKRAPFPKSHAGVIEIKKIFEYQVTQP